MPDIPGVHRVDLQRHDISAPGREVIQNRVEISPEAPATRHFHPGEEVIYVLEGTIKYEIDGEPAAWGFTGAFAGLWVQDLGREGAYADFDRAAYRTTS